MGWSTYGLSWVHRYHPELNWTELKTFWFWTGFPSVNPYVISCPCSKTFCALHEVFNTNWSSPHDSRSPQHLVHYSMENRNSSAVRVLDLWLQGHGFVSWQEWRENGLLQGQISALTLIFSICFTSPVTAVAHKRFWSFCPKCRWQVTAEHASTLHTQLCMKRHDMVVWCTQNAPRRQQFQPCNNQTAL